MNNKHELQVIAAAARKAADVTKPLLLDDEVRLILDDEVRKLKKRGWLRDGLDVADAILFARRSLVAAVERGWAEQQAASSQSNAIAQWRSLSDQAKRAVKSLDKLAGQSKFKIANLQVLCTTQHLATADFSGSSAALQAVQREAHSTAERLHSSIIAARQAAHTIADQADEMALNVAKLKDDPGEPFRRGFAIEMMKTWWLVTGRSPSKKRSADHNPFLAFADLALQSIHPDPNVPSCAGVVRSALPIFRELQEGDAFDTLSPYRTT